MTSSGTYTFGKIVKYEDGGANHPFTVYMAINKLNGASYIGATQKGTEGRASVHLTTARCVESKDQHFYRAVRKYGEENFKFITIKECQDYWDALESERAYIALFKPRYNMTDGGGGIKGHKMSAESRAKMSAAKKGKLGTWSDHLQTEHAKKRTLEALRSRKGTKRTGKGLEASLKGARAMAEARRKPVMELTSGNVYASVTEAAKANNLVDITVTALCRSGRTSMRGLKFKYMAKNE